MCLSLERERRHKRSTRMVGERSFTRVVQHVLAVESLVYILGVCVFFLRDCTVGELRVESFDGWKGGGLS